MGIQTPTLEEQRATRKPYARNVLFLIHRKYITVREFSDDLHFKHQRIYQILNKNSTINKYEAVYWSIHLGCKVSDLREIIRETDLTLKTAANR